MASPIRKGRSEEKSTKVRGGYYKLNKNPKGSKIRRGSQSKGVLSRSYHNQMHMRTGHGGTAAGAKQYTATGKRSLAGAAGAIAGGAASVGLAAAGHSKASVALGAAGYASQAYSIHQGAKGTRQLNAESGKKASAFGGFHSTHPNQSNAKTGVRSGSPARVKFGSRVGSK